MIKELEEKREKKKKKLEIRRMELEKHKKFNEFLESIVNDKNSDTKEFEQIADLENRFHNLKQENKKLMNRVSLILNSHRNNKLTLKWKN